MLRIVEIILAVIVAALFFIVLGLFWPWWAARRIRLAEKRNG